MESLATNPEAQKEKLIEEIFKRPTVIAVEGGPCSGKTTFVESLERMQAERPIVVLPEAAGVVAEQYLGRGIDVMAALQNDHNLKMRFEQEVLALTVEQINQAKEQYYGTDAVIVTDRVDIGAYVQADEYLQIIYDMGLGEIPLASMVDKVLYFPTLAKKDPKEYMRLRDNNPTRRETVEQAMAVCDANLRAVSLHPEFHYMDLGNFANTLEAATAYVLNPESEYEKGGYILGDPKVADMVLKIKESEGQLLPCNYIEQRYGSCEGLRYRLRREGLGMEYILPSYPTRIRYSISLKDKASNTELQRVISKQEYEDLYGVDDSEVAKMRNRFLHKDPINGTLNVWSVDNSKVGHRNYGLEFEVESYDQESTNNLIPPFPFTAPKTYSAEDLPKIEDKLKDIEKMAPTKKLGPNCYNDNDIPTYIRRPY